MLENMTTGEKVIAGATAVGIAALIFHKPTRNAVGLSDGKRSKKIKKYKNIDIITRGYGDYHLQVKTNNKWRTIAKEPQYNYAKKVADYFIKEKYPNAKLRIKGEMGIFELN